MRTRITSIPQTIPVAITLIGITMERTIVLTIHYAITITVFTRVAHSVAVHIPLLRIEVKRAIVDIAAARAGEAGARVGLRTL